MTSSGSSHDDVRMRGFAARSPVEEVISWVDDHSSVLPSVETRLAEAHSRVLAEDVIAAINVPAFDRSAMDGYAVRAKETSGAEMSNALSFVIVGQSLPGQPCDRLVGTGEAVRIMTGAPLPDGADAVVPAEVAEELDGCVDVLWYD